MLAPSRDRLARPVDISTMFRGAARRVDLIVDEPGLRWSGLSGNPTGSGSNGRSVEAQRAGFGHRRNFQRFPPVGRENRTPVRHGGTAIRGRGAGSVLPHWHPRTPLRDITGIVRAIERRREEVQVDQATERPPEVATNAPSGFDPQLEHLEVGASTPLPTLLMKPQLSPTTQAMKFKIVDRITLNEKWEDADFMTPEKKLLDSIEKVREVWLKEQRKFERTPAAKKAEREKKVRVLLSMR